MTKEFVISSNRHETKVAVLEDDQLVEVYFQRANEYSLAGSIHKGRVTRVLPGMQSAFVNLGLERDTFLYVSDFFEENEEYDKILEDRRSEPRPPSPAQAPATPTATPPAGEGAAPAAVPPERSDDGDRDRRSRRSRRRRNRGRGFPESKYAPEVAPPARPPEPAPASSEFAVLPGESLAKYAHAESEPPPEPAAAVEPVTEPQPEVEAIEEAPLQSVSQEEEEEEEEDPAVWDAAQVELEEKISRVQPDSDATAEEPTAEAGAPAEEPAPEVEEIPEPAGEETQPEAAEPVEAGPAEELEPARIPQSLTATLREQGGRYLHRVSRRMRRKMRGGPGEPRQGEQGRDLRPEPPHTVSRPDRPAPASISELLKEGQEILVQIAKEPLGQKGARITSHIALPGRYVVYMPTVEHLGVSRKISTDEERLRLKRIIQAHRAGMPGGFIVRTAGEGRTEDEIASDMTYLFNLWLDIRQKAEKRPAPCLLHHDLEIVQRVLRDQLTNGAKAVWVDNEDVYESVVRFVQRIQPALLSRVKLYTRSAPIFDAFNITAELEKALHPKIWLKSGGYIVINQTEALVAIDVNTGKYVGKSNRLEDTIVKTNTEAVKEIVRQMRLRDLGGIIVIDFIDMDERKNRQKVMQVLEEAMRNDRAPYKILQFNDFGLVAITRKRVKQSLERTLCAPCPYCEGAGYVKSVQTIIGEVLQEAGKVRAALEDHKDVILRVHPEVAKVLKSSSNQYLEEIEEILGRPVLVTSDPLLHHEKFDLA